MSPLHVLAAWTVFIVCCVLIGTTLARLEAWRAERRHERFKATLRDQFVSEGMRRLGEFPTPEDVDAWMRSLPGREVEP